MMKNQLEEQLNDLDDRILALGEDAKPVRQQLANIDRQTNVLRREREQVAAKLKEMREKPRVSDHAVVRYLERQFGFSFEDIREKLLTDVVRQAMDAGVESVKAHGGTLKIKGRTVTTFVVK